MNSTATALIYSTYLGGSGTDFGYGIALDISGYVYVTGSTDSINFPTTPGVVQTAFAGGLDAYVTKINPIGTALTYSTYLGGSNDDAGFGITLDTSGNAYVTGDTASANFPITPGAFQTVYAGANDVFVTKLNQISTVLIYSTFLGGSNDDAGLGNCPRCCR